MHNTTSGVVEDDDHVHIYYSFIRVAWATAHVLSTIDVENNLQSSLRCDKPRSPGN